MSSASPFFFVLRLIFDWHFTAVDTDANDPDYRAVFLFEGKTFDEQVDLVKGSFDYLIEVQDEIKRWGEWYVDTDAMDGVRFDAVKHVEAGFFPQWLQHVRAYAQRPIFAVGEYWSYDVEALHSFIAATGGDVALFDAPLHRNFSDASKSGNAYDMRQIFDNTLVKNEPALAVTLVANHDTQPLQALESVVEAWFKPLAYALILLRRDGYPCVFYADYYGANYTDKGRDGNEYTIEMACHRESIENQLKVRQDFAYGDQYDYFDDANCIGWTRTGDEEHPGGIAVLMQTTAPNKSYCDITGNREETITTDENGWAEFRFSAGSVSVWLPRDR